MAVELMPQAIAAVTPWVIVLAFVLGGGPEILKLAVLAFTAGVLTTLVVEELVPEAHEGGEARFGAMTFVAGFALFTLLSAYLG